MIHLCAEVAALKACYEQANKNSSHKDPKQKWPYLQIEQLKTSMATREQVLTLYRHILRAAKQFPSIKRNSIIADIKQEFKMHKALVDPELIRKEMEIGIRSLEQLEGYVGMNKTQASDWQVFLKGSCNWSMNVYYMFLRMQSMSFK